MKEGWEYKKLGDVAIIINGFAFKSSLFTKEGEKILRISNIQNDIVDLSDVVFFNKETYKQNLDKYKVYPDDILIALSGATTGKIGINKTNETLYLNQRVAICRESVKTLNHKYLYCFLKTKSLEFLKDAEGVAQPNLSTEQMKNYVLPIPPLSEQQHIIEELDLLSSIIEKKKAQLIELDNLAQSLFYEMFGDPITNEKEWKVKNLGELVKIINGFAFKSSLFTNKGEKILRISNIQNGIITLDDMVFFNKNTYRQNLDKYKVFPNDIAIALSGATTGKIGINKTAYEFYLNQRVAICREKSKLITRSYLLYFLKTKSMEFLRDAEGVAQPNLSTEQMKRYIVPLPPIDLQQQFASKIEAIEHQKELIQKSIKEVETLFNSRMDYYFN